MVKCISQQESIPVSFLTGILQELARKGLLRWSKGPKGGFALRLPSEDIKLSDIVWALDGKSRYTACASGLSECSDEMACPLHDSLGAVRTRIIEYLEGHTVADLARALEYKRMSLQKAPKLE